MESPDLEQEQESNILEATSPLLSFLTGGNTKTGLEDKEFSQVIPQDFPKDGFYWDFQLRAAERLFTDLYIKNSPMCVVRGGVGIGKTYILKRFLQYVFHSAVLDNKSLCTYPVFYVTKANIIEQTKRVLKAGGISLIHQVLVTNYDQLRASWGKGRYIDEITRVEHGVEYTIFKWKLIHPLLIIWDECQSLKNEDSQQSKIGQAANEIKHGMFKQIFCSATPFTKVSEAKCIAVASKMNIEYNERD